MKNKDKISIASDPHCPKCWEYLDVSQAEWYAFECTHCDEDFFSFEVVK